MPDKQSPDTSDLHERLAVSQQRSSWHQSVIIGIVVLILGLAVVMNGVPDVKNDIDKIIFGIVAMVMIYLVFIRKRKQDIDAETLVAILEREWKSGRLGHHTWDQLDFSLPEVLIEQLTDDFHLVSCHNPNGGTKTLGIHGNDSRSLRVVQVYSGDAPTTRAMLEKSKVVMTALERGHEIKKIETMMEKLGA
jgi:hypothetical protein